MNAALSLFIITALLPVASAQAAPAAEASGPRQTRDIRNPTPSFPRLMGMNIGAKNYDDPAYQRQLARLDVVILGFYQGWKPGYGMAQVVRNLKELSGGKSSSGNTRSSTSVGTIRRTAPPWIYRPSSTTWTGGRERLMAAACNGRPNTGCGTSISWPGARPMQMASDFPGG